MNPITIIQSTSLQFREGSSDKVYHAAIEVQGDGHIVTFAFGRRGTTLTTGTKTDVPVPLATATRLYDKLVASKLGKGYKPDGEPAAPYQQSGDEGHDSGIRCQLLNPVEGARLIELLNDSQHCRQEKHDGRRMLVRKKNGEITGINRRGLVVAIPEPIRHAVEELPVDVLIDGEAIGDTLHSFDLLELKNSDIRNRPYLHRYAGLLTLLDPEHKHLRPVITIVHPADKLAMFETYKQTGSEGVVFKDIEAPFNIGRPNSGGSQLKHKFVESASFIVTARNAKRSVTLGLFDGNELVSAGNVTIPPNHVIPQMGTVVDVKFLYAFRQSGSIYQPVYLGKRDDIPATECVTDQFKYKSEVVAA
ncbi:MAG: WGR domain-containing protein [Alphaproteobacteria bacterium]|nr:MAG: WGR domain-containing protein [Alphaproteobacteria bacterium]